MHQVRLQIFSAVVLWLASFSCLQASDHAISLSEALMSRGTVIMLRHAIAPGIGDPSNFQIDNCTSQRNLDQQGRSQAVQIGEIFKQSGFPQGVIYSSPWCRCLETAELMDLGSVQSFSGLSSFFEGHVDRNETIRALKIKIKKLEIQKQYPTVMVTHQVIISAMTGKTTASGQAVLYDSNSDEARRIQF